MKKSDILLIILFIVFAVTLYLLNAKRLDNYSKWYCSQVYKLNEDCSPKGSE